MYFKYGETEINYLKKKDKKLGEVIDKIGHLNREVNSDLFSAIVNTIIGQQISTKAQITIWKRMKDELGEINAETILNAGVEKIKQFGTSFRKAEYIIDFAKKVKSGEFRLEGINGMTDDEVIAELSSLKGIGVWTAEMIMLFCLQRSNVFSYGDLAILRGLRMVYHHKDIDRERFEKYRKRFSPYCSVASLYFWAVAGGAIEGMKDYKINKK
ncbi:DNA-3-methyladenine glycosylase family protein [Ureibacillus manganicus]|uniref:DNA-3-methyladenine glycosylase II n=1 Tax=Ureibacillus manganicus DSM 26584 TaxID=1384049 RepID=A0A0A3I8R8_9BACL|nr:DNA-3-methyladenine glycosylase [Ureibacillus manganicus]KGR79168.1 DNA-3-methyladenine glycosidase [Ureibacillus manganicus DSM 26584]